MSDCPRVMTLDQMLVGLKAGMVLCVDRRDAPELPELLDLERQGLVLSEMVEVETQYSYLRFWWKEPASCCSSDY